MNDVSSLNPLGHRDLKSAAKSLKCLLASHPQPMDRAACLRLVSSWSPASNAEPSETIQASSVTDVKLGSNSAQTFIPLGRIQSPKAPVSTLQWTHEAALGHALVYGAAGAGVSKALISWAQSAMRQDVGVFHFHDHPDIRSQVLGAARHQRQEHRLRVICLDRPDIPGHTFNPFATGPAPKLASILSAALLASISDIDGVKGQDLQRRLRSLCDAVMAYLVWKRDTQGAGLDLGRVADGLSFTGMWSAAQDAACPDHIQQPLRSLVATWSHNASGHSDRFRSAYRSWEKAIVDDVLMPAAIAYASVLESTPTSDGWSRPGLDMVQAFEQGQWVFWVLPALENVSPWSLFPAHLALAQLASHVTSEALSSSSSSSAKDGVRAVLMAHECGRFITGDLVMPLIELGPVTGLCCIWADQDYPAMTMRKDGGMLDVISRTNTKIFLKMENTEGLTDMTSVSSRVKLWRLPALEAHAIHGSTLHSIKIDSPVSGKLPVWQLPGANIPLIRRSVDRQTQVLHDRLCEPGAQPEKLSWCQETLARMLGYALWHEALKRL